MSPLRQSLSDYLGLRRALGFKLERAGRLLEDFVAFVEQTGAATVTVELALRWASLPQGAQPVWLAQRLGAVRGFACYLSTLDPDTQVPPAGLLVGRYQRVPPYLYSDADIAALMDAARTLEPALRAVTFETLIGLLAVTGLRVGEAMRIDRDDVDWSEGVLMIRASKFGKTRQVPVHTSTLDALGRYAEQRDRSCPCPQAPSLFVSTAGTRLSHSTVQPAFREIRRRAGLDRTTSVGRRPRIHDLRHTFAVRTLIGLVPGRRRRGGPDAAAVHLPGSCRAGEDVLVSVRGS